MRGDHRVERHRLSGRGGDPALPGQLLRAARVRPGRVQQVGERVIVGRLTGRLELELEILEEVDAADLGQLHLGGLAEHRLFGALEHHLQCVPDRAGEQQRHVVGSGAHERGADHGQWVSGAVPEPLELVEDDDEVIR